MIPTPCRRRAPVAVLLALMVAVLACAPARGQEPEGERESPPKFTPPEELLRNSRGVLERTPVGARFGPGPDRAEQTQVLPGWTALGPMPIAAEYWSGGAAASGRVNSIVVDPRDGNVAYAAAAYGGVWKTLNGGTLWMPMTDGLPSLASGALALDPLSPDIVWYGTGEQNFAIDSFYGDGLFRSPDGGTTWSKIAGTATVGSYIARVVVHPTTPSTIYIASELGVVRSTDSGANWTVTLGLDWCTDLVQNPSDPSILYAASLYGGVYRSTNGGSAWVSLAGGLPSSGVFRVNLAISPSNPQVLLAGFGSSANYDLLGLYRSSDGGDSWAALPATPDYLGGQGFYNHVIAIDPLDSAVAFAGGVYPYSAGTYGLVRTLDSGGSWTDVTKGLDAWMHPDFHAIAFGPDGRMWVGNDGGVWRTADHGAHWANLNSTLSITQFYTLAVQPGGGGRIIGGTQDNGTLQYIGTSAWTQVVGGDGGPVEFNRSNPNVLYATYVYMNPLYRGTTSSSSLSNITGPWTSDRSSWANGGLVVDPNATITLLAGTYRVWRTTLEGATWTAISGDLTGGGVIRSLAVATGYPSMVVASTSDGRVQVTTNLSTWSRRDTGLPALTLPSIVINPADPNDLVVCAARNSGGRVYVSGDAGLTWSDRTGDLPAGVQVNTLAADFRAAPPTLLVGSNDGVFASGDGGAHWSEAGTGLPASAVVGIGLDPPIDLMVAATHGRGMWRVPIPFVARPRIAEVAPAFRRTDDTALGLTVTGTGFRPGAVVRVDGDPRTTTYVNAARLTATLTAADIAAPGTHAISVLGADPYPMLSADSRLTVLSHDGACCMFADANVARAGGANGATAVQFADFDADGVQDLAFARLDANEVVVRRGLADGTFVPWTTVAIAGPRDLAAGDLDGDGLPDLAVAQPALNRVSVIYRTGAVGFGAPDTLVAGVSPARVVLGDLDNDGRLDLVVGQNGPYLVRFYNDGPGTGGATRSYRRLDLLKAVYSSPAGVALADVDRDGFLDYLSGNRNSTTSGVVSGVNAFPVRSYTGGNTNLSIVAGFFNADSLPDYAVGCAGDSTIVVFRNTGGANFSRTVVPARRNPLDLEATDVDGDGATDLVAVCAGAQTLSVLLGHNDGTFSAPLDFDAGRRPASIALRGDRLALAVADSLGDPTVLRLDARLMPMAFATGDAPRDVAAADLDGDLSPDLVTANGDGTLSVLFGNGDGTLARRVSLAAGGAVQAVAIADFDGDTQPDLAAALRNGTLALWRNAGARAFTAQPPVVADTAARDLAVGDGDGAGDALDLVLTTPTSAQVFVHGSGFAFSPATAVAAPPADPFSAARVRDVDGDGTPDLIAGANDALYLHHGTGGGAFAASGATFAGGPATRALAVADVSGDGLADLVYVSRSLGDLVVRKALGGGAFAPGERFGADGGASHLVLADVTGDGRADAVMADSTTGRLLVLAGTGSGTFGPLYPFRATRGAVAVATGDFDRDGQLDAAVGGLTDALAAVHLKLGPNGPLGLDDEVRAVALAFSDIHPNPASGPQWMRFTVPRRGEVDLRVFDIAGRAVATLARGEFPPGEHAVAWDGRTGAGAPALPGVYFVRLRAGGEQVARRIARMR